MKMAVSLMIVLACSIPSTIWAASVSNITIGSNFQDDATPAISFEQPEITASASLNDGFSFPKRQFNVGGLNISPYGLSNSAYGNSPFALSSASYEKPNCLGTPAGMYGSPTYNCQVYYVCQSDGRLDAMPCALGTKFNNLLGVCDWPQKIDANCNPLYTDQYVNQYVNPSSAVVPQLQQYQSFANPYSQYSSSLYAGQSMNQAPRFQTPVYNRF